MPYPPVMQLESLHRPTPGFLSRKRGRARRAVRPGARQRGLLRFWPLRRTSGAPNAAGSPRAATGGEAASAC
jgi:hypothetical protein